MRPVLSIAIPSNNRTELLDEAVQSILKEPAFDVRCEICISDNSSSEETKTLVVSKYKEAEQVVYQRSLDFPSLDENVNRAVTIANGEYVWIFGDDDLIVEGFLSQLLVYLQTIRPGILIVNSSSFHSLTIVEERRVPINSIEVFGPQDDDVFLEKLGGYLTYVGGIVIRKSLWNEYFRPQMLGTYFAHIDTICRAKIGRSIHYLPQPGIRMRLHTQTWTSKHFEIWNIKYPEVIWGLESYSVCAKNSVIPKYPLKSMKRIVASRAYGRFNLGIWWSALRSSEDSSVFVRLIGLLVALLPREGFRLLYILFIRTARRRHSRNFSPELALAQLKRAAN